MAKRLPRFKPFDPAAGPWLIWSHHWNCWHQRSSEGGASGYTDDIAQAGVFDERMARAYHDPPPHRRDEAVPARKAIKQAEARLAIMDAERAAFAVKVDRLRKASAPIPAPPHTLDGETP